MDKISSKIKTLPSTPGVYLHYDANGNIIYIGKAKSLKNRVKSYFNNTDKDNKTKALVSNISDFLFIKTKTESEALLLEKELVSIYLPKYNVLLKDDKRYPYIKITNDKTFPTISKARKIDNTGKYFGPFASNIAVNETIDLLNSIFSLKRCPNKSFTKNHKPCFNYHIKSCLGYCIHPELIDYYNEKIYDIESFLKKKDTKIVETVKTKMKEASENLNYERAAELKKSLEILEKINEKNRNIKYVLKKGLEELKEKIKTEQYIFKKLEKIINKKINIQSKKIRIESYDISHTNGIEIVGSEVVYYGLDKAKSEYRKYKIKGNDVSDIYTLQEVLSRRFNNLIEKRPNFNIKPDIVLIDGGVIQLNTIQRLLEKFQLTEIIVLGMVKDSKHKTRGLVYLTKNGFEEFKLKNDMKLYKFISEIQNETHRFAITFHKKRLSKKIFK